MKKGVFALGLASQHSAPPNFAIERVSPSSREVLRENERFTKKWKVHFIGSLGLTLISWVRPSHFGLVGQAVPADEILKKVMNCYELL